MHIVLVGPGALGCLLASRLSRSAPLHRLTLLDHNQSRARMLQAHGLRYFNQENEEAIHLAVSSSPRAIGVADVVMLCVKSYDVVDSLRFCAPLQGPDTLLVFMQNGVAHLDIVVDSSLGTPAYGTTTEGATLVGPGQVRHAGKGLSQFGFLHQPSLETTRRLRQVTELFTASGLAARTSDNILSRLWTKLVVNVGINGLTALLGCPNGELLVRAETAQRMETLVAEALAVARAANISVPADSLAITREVCTKTAANISSMLQDVRAKRRTEIEAINGAIVARGKKYGIATPENSRLVAEIQSIEQRYLQHNA
ncbi:MAG: ketopantoate reductase family protein [Desulfopila sp.]